MFVAPVVVHLSRLVTDRGKRPEAVGEGVGDENKAAGEGEDTRVPCQTEIRRELQTDKAKDGLVFEESGPSKEKKIPQRKQIRIRRLRQTKAKAKRQSKPATPITGTNAKCRLPIDPPH